MYKWVATALLGIIVLLGCGRPRGTPEQALSKFLGYLEKGDFDEARKYATSDSQDFLKMLSDKSNENENIFKDKSFTIGTTEIHGNEAKVQMQASTGSRLYYYLREEDGEWKVLFNEKFLSKLINDVFEQEGQHIKDDVNHAIDSIKINLDSLP